MFDELLHLRLQVERLRWVAGILCAAFLLTFLAWLGERHDGHSLRRQLNTERGLMETKERFYLQSRQDSLQTTPKDPSLHMPEKKDNRPPWVPDILLLPFNS
jgi:hypothetical protein